jgi:putative PIN family toxin of toxin-antitoxin system
VRFVIDTGVFISALLYEHSVPANVVDKAVAHGRLIFTKDTHQELEEVLSRPKFDRYITNQIRKDFLRDVTAMADFVSVLAPIMACRDEKDNKFLEAAVFGGADYLISGDDDLLELHPFMEIPIFSPAAFLQALI